MNKKNKILSLKVGPAASLNVSEDIRIHCRGTVWVFMGDLTVVLEVDHGSPGTRQPTHHAGPWTALCVVFTNGRKPNDLNLPSLWKGGIPKHHVPIGCHVAQMPSCSSWSAIGLVVQFDRAEQGTCRSTKKDIKVWVNLPSYPRVERQICVGFFYWHCCLICTSCMLLSPL